MLKLSLNLIWRYTTGDRSRLRFHTLPGELIDRVTAESWCTNWFAATDWRKQTGEICWVLAFFVYSSGLSLQRLSFLECAAQSRGSCPSSAAPLWAQILPMCAALCRGEEAARLFESTANPGEDRTEWEMLTTERGGRPNSSIRLADALVSPTVSLRCCFGEWAHSTRHWLMLNLEHHQHDLVCCLCCR